MEAHAESFIHEKGLTQHTLKEHMGRFFLKTFGYALHGENKNLCGISLIKYIFNSVQQINAIMQIHLLSVYQSGISL